MIKRGATIWDYIAWASLVGISIWLILKIMGIISTPDWIEYVPLSGAVYLAGWAMHKLDRASEDVKDLNVDIRDLRNEVKPMNNDVKDLRNEIRPMNNDVNKLKANCPIFNSK